MARMISKNFINDLKVGMLKEILETVKCDDTLCMEIRDSFISIYYRGGSLMRIEEKKSGVYHFFFNKKYIIRNPNKVSVDNELLHVNDPESIIRLQKWIDEIPQIKHEMDFWFYKNPSEEREYQQLVIKENNYGGCSNSTDYFICDMEYANKYGRFDMIAIKWPSKASDRKNSSNVELAFIEMKYSDKALTKKSGLADHAQNMVSFLSKQDVVCAIHEEMKNIFNLKIELGLIQNVKKIDAFNKNSDYKPEYIFLIANHDPDKSVLEREIRELLKSSIYALLKTKANVMLSKASFMGYGLYHNLISDIKEFVIKDSDNEIKKDKSIL